MDFRLLGVLEVGDGGRLIDLPRAQERALLVLLLLHPNEPVARDRLVDELWGDRAAPASAAKAIQVYVSRLRKALGPGRLETTPGGYRLRVEDDELDTDRFRELAATVHAQLENADADQALRTGARALELWRGDVLTDVRFASFAQGEIRRLEELRYTISADCIDARLQLGKTEGLIAELERTIELNPLSERPRAQLMLALYRSGRQADALELYRTTRAMLNEELGIEPGPELQALERSMLNHDPALDAPRRATRVLAARRGGLLLIAGGLLAVAAAATAVVLVSTRGGQARIARLAPGSIGVVDERSGAIAAETLLEGEPARIAAGSGGVWVGGDQAGTLTEFAPASREVRRVVPTSGFPSAVAIGEHGMWVFDGAAGVLTERDPTYGTALHRTRVTPPNPSYDRTREAVYAPYSVAVGASAAWTTDGSATLTKVSSLSGRIVGRFGLRAALDGVAVHGDDVWVVSGTAATLYHVVSTGRVTFRVPIASRPAAASPYPIAVAVGAGFVWVLNANTATVTKIDPVQRTVVATISIGIERRPARIVAGAGAAWVADQDGTLARIDAANNGVRIARLGGSLRDLALVRGSVWVTAAAGTGTTASTASAVGGVQALPTVSCTPIESAPGARPDLLLVGDLALQGGGSSTTAQTGSAIRFVLAQHHFRAGRYTVGYQSCDSSAPNGDLNPARCAANARADAADPSVIGVIGSWGSSCTEVQLPILDRAPDGPVGTVGYSSSNTGITHAGPGSGPGEPGKYYPAGTRNYVRVIPPNDVQGRADAIAALRLGARRIFVLEDDFTGYGAGIAAAFTTAARRLGAIAIGPRVWNYAAKSYQPFVDRIAQLHPDAIFLGTFLAPETLHLLRELKAALPDVQLIGPDGFFVDDLIAQAGRVAEGMAVSENGVPVDRLPAAGRRFASAFRASTGAAPKSLSVVAAQATEVMLAAIARSDGTRSSVVHQLFATRVRNGLLGSFAFDRDGDTTAGSITIRRVVHGRPTVFAVITPPGASSR